MLTIILGVTCYLFFKQYQTASAEAQKNQADATEQRTAAKNQETEANNLKQWIGGATQDTNETLRVQFADDMKKYGGAYPREVHAYHPLLEKVAKTLAEKNDELLKAKSEMQAYRDQVAASDAAKDWRKSPSSRRWPTTRRRSSKRNRPSSRRREFEFEQSR